MHSVGRKRGLILMSFGILNNADKSKIFIAEEYDTPKLSGVTWSQIFTWKFITEAIERKKHFQNCKKKVELAN